MLYLHIHKLEFFLLHICFLKEEGYNVIGITLQLYSSNSSAKKGSCCSGIDIYDARRVAQKLDIPHYVFNYEKTFKEDVIDYFIQSYENGETPIPCVKCNETVKFRDLLGFAKKLDADKIRVTGNKSETKKYFRHSGYPGGVKYASFSELMKNALFGWQIFHGNH